MIILVTVRSIHGTHAAVRGVIEAGLPKPHAEVVICEQVQLIKHDLTIKSDIATFRVDIEEL